MSPVAVSFDAAPLRQSFGACNVVFDGVATRNGTEYRVNVTATRGGRKPEVMLRYLTPAKSGQAVPETMLADVRAAVVAAAVEHLAPYRAAYVAECRARDEAAGTLPVEFDAAVAEFGTDVAADVLEASEIVSPVVVPLCDRCDAYGAAQGDCPTCCPDTAPVAFVVYSGSYTALCEGGVYSATPSGEYAANTIAAAHAYAAELNSGSLGGTGGAYQVRRTLEGVKVEAEVCASLEAWQLELVEAQPIPMMSLGNVRQALRRLDDATAVEVGTLAQCAAPVVVANTTRAVYWRNSNGYVATGPDVRAEAVAAMGGYANLASIMGLKGEARDTIARLVGQDGHPRPDAAPRLSYPISYRWKGSDQRHHTTTSGDSMQAALDTFKRDNPGTVSHCITHPDHA